MSEEMSEILKKKNSYPIFKTSEHGPHDLTFCKEYRLVFCLQAARYRREGSRILQEGQRVRTDTWSDFRVQVLCPVILAGHKQRVQV